MNNALTYCKVVDSAEDMQAFAATLAPFVRDDDLIILNGDLGAGKTCFVQGLAQGLGVDEPVTSPTFDILQVYPQGRVQLNHFDLYRIESADDLEDIGFFDIIESGGVSCIEWGAAYTDLLANSFMDVFIKVQDDGRRRLTLRAIGTRARSLLTVWAHSDGVRMMQTTGE